MHNSTTTEHSFTKVGRRRKLHEHCHSVTIADQDRPEKHVSFGKVMIRSYERVLGDHPKCKHGPAIALGWNTVGPDMSYDFENYQQNCHRSSPKRCFKLSPQEREELLSNEWTYEQEIIQHVYDLPSVSTSKRKSRNHNASTKTIRRNTQSKHSLTKHTRGLRRPRLWIPEHEMQKYPSELVGF